MSSTVIPCLRYRDAPKMLDWLCTTFGFHKHLVVLDEHGVAQGWCQWGSPEELPTIKHKRIYLKEPPSKPDWRITWFYVAPNTVAKASLAPHSAEPSSKSPALVAVWLKPSPKSPPDEKRIADSFIAPQSSCSKSSASPVNAS